MRPCYFTDVHPLAIEKLRAENAERASYDLIVEWINTYEKIKGLSAQQERLEQELHAEENARVSSASVGQSDSLISERKELEYSLRNIKDEELMLRQRLERLDHLIKRSGG